MASALVSAAFPSEKRGEPLSVCLHVSIHQSSGKQGGDAFCFPRAWLVLGNAEFFHLARRKPFSKGGWTLPSCPPWKKAQQRRQTEKISVSLMLAAGRQTNGELRAPVGMITGADVAA